LLLLCVGVGGGAVMKKSKCSVVVMFV